MKGFVISVLFLLVCTLAFVEGFAGFEWGVSKESVIEEFGDPILEQSPEPDTQDISFMDEIAGYPCVKIFRFYEGGLVFGTYTINKPDVDVYQDLERKLKSKYGEPVYSELFSAAWMDGKTMIRLAYEFMEETMIQYGSLDYLKVKQKQSADNTEGL